jgi:hypothetical protein
MQGNPPMGTRLLLRSAALLAAALAAVPLVLPQAAATVIEAGSTPARIAVAATGPATVTATWRVVRQEADLPNPGTVSSPRLRILIDTTVVADLPRPLARALPGVESTETALLREIVQIPEALVFRAVKQRATLRLERTFADSPGDTPEVAGLLVTPSGPASAAVAIERLALAFDDDARTRVLPKGGDLRAVAEINSSGVGLITGQWEVASAATTAGTPVFRPLALVRQGVAGGGRTVITSPRLPAAEEGTHLVRFRVVEPALAIDAPALQYYITPRAPGAAPAAPSDILVAGPRPGDSLTAATRFAWHPLDGAEAYQLAFYAAPAGPAAPLDPASFPQAQLPQAAAPDAGETAGAPLAGIFVPGDRSEAVAEAFTLAQLPGGRSYLWKVLAIDANGAVIGSSSTREIYKP